MSSLNYLSGWSRSGNLEAHDMPERPPHPALRILTERQTPTSAISPASIDPVKLSSSILPTPRDFGSPSSDTSSSLDHASSEVGTLSDQDLELSQPQQQAQVNQEGEPVPKHGDPTWVARPRNPFIIFRCVYSRKNCREGKRIRRPSGAPPEKSLSKRAAEAWYVLPKEEKMKYKELADVEREEHAKMYPQYRFRPAKRGVKTRRATAIQEQHQQAQSAAECMLTDQGTEASQELNTNPVPPNPPSSFDPPLSPNAGDHILISPVTLPSQAGHGLGSTPVGSSMPGLPRADLIKANRRRSCSQPIPLPGLLYAPGSWRRPSLPTATTAARQPVAQVSVIKVSHITETDGLHCPEFERSRSATGSWSMPLARQPVCPHGSGTPYEQYSASGSASPQTRSLSPNNAHSSSYGATQRSLASSSSSLANWNREVDESFVYSASSASSSPWINMATLNISSSVTASPLNSPGQQQSGEYINLGLVVRESIPPYFVAENEAGMQGIYTPPSRRCNTSTTLTGIGEENIGDYMILNDMFQCSEMTDTYDLLGNIDFAAGMLELNSTTTSLDHEMVTSNAVHGDPASIQRGQYGSNDVEMIPPDLDQYLHSL